MVRQMLAKNIENKTVGNPVETNVLHNSPIGAADCVPLIPQIPPMNVNNTTDTSMLRIGDRISPKSLRVKGTVSFTPQSVTTTQNIYVRIIIAAQKNIKVGSQVASGAVDSSHLLRPAFPGAGIVAAAFDGNTDSLDFPVNRDLFRVYMDKIIKLAPQASTGVETMPMYSARWSYRFKSLPAHLTFDTGNGDWVNNFAPFVGVGYAYSDGTSPDILTTRIRSNIYSALEFEDA